MRILKPLKSVVFCLSLSVGAGACLETLAASQGQWGRTSTATAKITLRIHPKPSHPLGYNAAEFQTGFDSLKLYCKSLQNHQKLGVHSPYYRINLAEQSNSPLLNSALKVHCQGGNSLVAPTINTDTATIIIAPY